MLIGVSIPGLLATNMELSGSAENTVDRHFYSMISYDKKLSNDWTAHPSILVKTTSNHNQIDANINFKLKNKLWFGTSYRQDFGPTIYVGIDFGKLLSVYSLDISTNEVADYSNGSHELTFGYDFIPDSELETRNRKEENLEEEIKDKDKDGVVDDEDLCPDVSGDKNAYGCPDFDGNAYTSSYSLTGYNVRKFLVPLSLVASYDNSPLNFPVLRYADVLLMKAEALNELGQTSDAEAYINRVRNRANLPNLTPGLDMATFREAVLHERRMELAFEGQRWFDMIRVNNGQFGLDFLHSIGKTNATEKHLLFPIPQIEIDRNPNLIQNPGW